MRQECSSWGTRRGVLGGAVLFLLEDRVGDQVRFERDTPPVLRPPIDSARELRMSEELQAAVSPTALQQEVADRFGLLPNFFQLGPDTPEITRNLWGFAKFG